MSIFLAGNRSLDIIPFFVFSSKQKQKLHENLYFLSELKREPIGLHIKKQPRRWWQNQKVTVLLYYRTLVRSTVPAKTRVLSALAGTLFSKRFDLCTFTKPSKRPLNSQLIESFTVAVTLLFTN